MGPDGLLLEVNEGWVDYTGYSRNEALGRSFANFLDPTSSILYNQDAVPELINTVPAQESRSVEYRLIKSSGEVVDVVLIARPQRDPVTGRFLYSLTVINDVTARNRAEKALRQAQKLEALGLLTGGVAHDFNNLLAIIQGSLELLLRRLPPEDARASRLMETALQGAKRGAAMTARLLAFARQQELSPQPVVVRTLIASLRPMLVQLLGPDITLTEELSPDLWTLRADRTSLNFHCSILRPTPRCHARRRPTPSGSTQCHDCSLDREQLHQFPSTGGNTRWGACCPLCLRQWNGYGRGGSRTCG